jgi:hypothetical protein
MGRSVLSLARNVLASIPTAAMMSAAALAAIGRMIRPICLTSCCVDPVFAAIERHCAATQIRGTFWKLGQQLFCHTAPTLGILAAGINAPHPRSISNMRLGRRWGEVCILKLSH